MFISRSCHGRQVTAHWPQQTLIQRYSTHFYTEIQYTLLYKDTVHTFIQIYSTHIYTEIQCSLLYRYIIHTFIQMYITHFYTEIQYTHFYTGIQYTHLYKYTVHTFIQRTQPNNHCATIMGQVKCKEQNRKIIKSTNWMLLIFMIFNPYFTLQLILRSYQTGICH